MLLAERAGLLAKLQKNVVGSILEPLNDWDRLLRIRFIGEFAMRADTVALEILRSLASGGETDAWEILADVGDMVWLTQHILPTMSLDEKWRAGLWLDENPSMSDDILDALHEAKNEFDVVQTKNETERQNLEPLTFDETLEEIQKGNNYVRGLLQLGTILSDDQAINVANLWLNEKDFRKSRNYLKLFRISGYPLSVRHIVDLYDQGNPPWRFEEIVSQFQHQQVREFGLKLICQPEPDYRGYICLTKSFQPDDLPVMEAGLSQFLTMPGDDLHLLAMGLRSLAEMMTPQERLPFLVWAYEHTPCSACRGWTAEIMIQDGNLPDAYREELRFDADTYARELASKYG
jgi:hypothetical protein